LILLTQEAQLKEVLNNSVGALAGTFGVISAAGADATGTFREHSGKLREHSGNIEGTLSEYSADIQGTFRGHSGNI
jgi:ABC-type transporter Mla subunit MlaD